VAKEREEKEVHGGTGEQRRRDSRGMMMKLVP